MTVSPKGMSIQTMYRNYRDGTLIVNRQYQRKLVWTVQEKIRLIDSIQSDYPLPLFLFAEKQPIEPSGEISTEVIDGLQRLNAIFSFIEHGFEVNGKCFDLKEFARARQASEQGIFSEMSQHVERLSAESCANFLDYQLAVTAFSGEDELRITDIFGRINSGGRQLSDQERRQAGVLTNFAELVRKLSAEIRGDVSKKRLPLHDMPEISIETAASQLGYKLRADEIFWCRQGILRNGDLRDSDDEEMMTDICASILFEGPVAGTGVYRNRLYDKKTHEGTEVNKQLGLFGAEKIATEIKLVFSAIRSVVDESSDEANHFRSTVYPQPTSNAQKSPFYAVFMAFYELMFKEGMYPDDSSAIMKCLTNLTDKISVGQKQTRATDRLSNINIVKGLIRDHFVKKDVEAFKHGAGLVLEFENSITRSRTETSRYEFKQGILHLDNTRALDPNILPKIIKTICGIANVGPDADGFIYIGIADKAADVNRIKSLDNIEPVTVRHVSVVGVDREAKYLGLEIDKYVKKVEDAITKSKLAEPLKTMMATSIDTISYKTFEVIRIRIPKQKTVSFVGDDCFIRVGSSTQKANGPQVAAVAAKFS